MLDTEFSGMLTMRKYEFDIYPSDSELMPCCYTILHSDPHPCILLQFPLSKSLIYVYFTERHSFVVSGIDSFHLLLEKGNTK